jgi:hypothetical protein
MTDKTQPRADYAPNEKKVWRPEAASQVFPPESLHLPDGIYFIAIEELQGAWIDGEWEEAGFDADDYPIPRSRRYVLKRFTSTGFAENAFSGSFSGPRQYKK